MVAGIVNNTSKGLMNRFKKARTAANNIATQMLATSTPGNNAPEMKIARVVTRNFMSCESFIILIKNKYVCDNKKTIHHATL